MEIGGPYPFRAAVAYQAMQASRPARLERPMPVSQPAAVSSAQAPASVQSVSTTAIDRLVAGRVPGGMDFELSTPQPVQRHDAFQLYTRDADRIEAATGVERGRIIDLKG